MTIPAGIINNGDNIQDEYDALITALNAQALDGQNDFCIPLNVPALTNATTVPASSVDFTAPDDLELRTLRLSTTGVVGPTVTATLTVTDGDSSYLLEHAVSVSVVSIAGTAHGNVDARSTTQAIRVRLLRGVRYRLAVTSNSATATAVSAAVVLRTRRRRR